MRKTFLVTTVVLATTALLAACAPAEPPPEPVEPPVPVEPAAPVAPTFTITGVDGREYSLAGLTATTPAFIVFWKEVCPHNPRSMPHFNAMREAYGENTPLVHLVWVSPEKAGDWAEQLDAKSPVLPDPEGELVQAYGKVQSVVTVKVGTDGAVADSFRGYGQEELARLNADLAAAMGVPAADLDFSAAPEKQTYG